MAGRTYLLPGRWQTGISASPDQPSSAPAGGGGGAGFAQQRHPRPDITPVVVVGSAADEVAVHHARLVDVDPAAHLQVETALGHGRHAAALDAAGAGRDLHPVAHAGDRLAGLEEVPGDGDE